MATQRANPYMQFNFTVDLGTGIVGGFQEISGIGLEIATTEYRNGNDPFNHVRKLGGLNKASDVTLKRGIFGTTELYQWLNQIRNGDVGQVRESVTIRLMAEDHTTVAMTWSLKKARIGKYTSGPMNAKGNDVAMEEIVMPCERIEIE
jgi:phage tail-like protein